VDRLLDVFRRIREGLGGPGGTDARLLFDGLLEGVVGEGHHAAVGVVDEDDLLSTEQALADRERADLVFGYDASGVADDVRLPVAETEDRVDIQACIHTRDDGDLLRWRQWERPGELRRVGFVVLE
jgi:hypothetical protein